MKTDKTKLLKDIEAMKKKLASMEAELNKPDEYKHFPSKGDEYYSYYPKGDIAIFTSLSGSITTNAHKTREEAQEAYKKAVAVEKVKRRIAELQGDWNDDKEVKFCIQYDHYERMFMPVFWFITQPDTTIPFMKDKITALTIIKEMEDELKLIFEIQ